jgi:hypothetical protein
MLFQDKHFSQIISLEGNELSNDPFPTCKGIQQSEYDNYRKKLGLPGQEIQLVSDKEARDIYINNYWIPAGCNTLPDPFDFCFFQCVVNLGNHKAIGIMRTSMGMLAGGGLWFMPKMIYEPVIQSHLFLLQQQIHYITNDSLTPGLQNRTRKTATFGGVEL